LQPETLQQESPRLREIPFDSRRRLMSVVLDWHSTLWANEHPYLCFTKGAPLEVLRHCDGLLQDGQVQELTQSTRNMIISANDNLARQGFRVLGIAVRQGGAELLVKTSAQLEQDLTFIGLVAIFDPPREQVKDAIAECHQAGISVTMITGDYGLTAEAIAKNLGLVTGKARVVTGEELGHLSEAQLRQLIH
jgi:magnesium-transporting ATPase (P-type)